ncbi:glycosyltransferase family 2 protein [Arcticibacter sp. MXS-1]|uniref:glycosyltransferase family 2 protein n=1 Tax=Arcticibacter sp. MXS-1 TaxID=3341726 RepID=UPI0035A983D2
MANDTLPLITIITVTYNAGDYLEQCIQNVQSLKYPWLEHVIIDGNSSDNTREILKQKSDQITFWKSEPDRGAYDAMNKAVKHAKGDWILFLGADDTLLQGFDEMAYNLRDKNTIYYGNHYWGDELNGLEFDSYQLTKENVCHQSIFYPSSVFRKYQYNERYKLRADHVLNMQVWGDRSFGKKYFPLTIARYAPGGLSAQSRDFAYYADKPKLILKHLGLICYFRYKFRCYRNKRKGAEPDIDLLY